MRVALAAAILGFAPWILEPFNAFKAVLLCAIGLPLLVWWCAEALSGRAAWRHPLLFAVLGWAVVGALATWASISPHLSLWGELGQREGLLTTLALSGLALAAAHAHRDERDVRGTLATVLVCAVAAAVYGQFQLAGLDPIHWQGVHSYTAQGTVAMRPAGPLGNPILLGAVLAAALPALLVRLAARDGDAARLVPAAAVVAASLLMTLSRGAWLASLAAGAVGLALALAAGAERRRAAWTTAASLAPALLLGALRAAGPIAARLGEGAGSRSDAARALFVRGALRLWRERPWLGQGPDTFGLAYPRVQEPALWREEWIGTPTHAHSVPVHVLATLGVLGLLAGLAWLVTALLAWRRAWREAPGGRATLASLAALLVASAVAGVTNVVGLAGAAVFAACASLPIAFTPRPERPGRRAPSGVIAGLAFACVLPFAAHELAALAIAQPGRAVTPGGGAALETSRAADAWRAAKRWPYDDVLWRLASDASLAEARALADTAAVTTAMVAEHAARRALALEPLRAANLAHVADALGERALRARSAGLADSADALFESASALAPADGWLLVSWIRFELARRDGARALDAAQRLVRMYPEAAMGHALSGAALLLLGRTDAARTSLLHARAARWEEDAGAQRDELERLLARLGPVPAGADSGAAPRR